MENNLILEHNEVLVASLTCHSEVKLSSVAKGILLNLLICPIAGICNRYKLSVTDKNIYVEQLSYCAGLYETVYTDKFNLDDIKIFEVTMIEDNKELIKIVNFEGKELKLINSNSKGNNIASQVAKNLNKH